MKGTDIIDAIIRADAIERCIVLENGNQIFVWRSNAAEQIEAALEEINNEQNTQMNDPQNEPRTCPYCDQPRQDTFPNRIRFRCGSATRQPGHVTPKQSEECQLRVALRAARAEALELREALEWLEDEAPFIVDDAWTNSVDMSGNRWTLRVRIDGPTQKFRGKTLIETIQKARYAAALAKKEAQP